MILTRDHSLSINHSATRRLIFMYRSGCSTKRVSILVCPCSRSGDCHTPVPLAPIIQDMEGLRFVGGGAPACLFTFTAFYRTSAWVPPQKPEPDIGGFCRYGRICGAISLFLFCSCRGNSGSEGDSSGTLGIPWSMRPRGGGRRARSENST